MMHQTIRAFGSFVPLALLLGCSSYTLQQPTEAPIEAFGPASSHAATVCVVRPSHWDLTATFVVHDDTQLVGATKGESYFCYLAEPGPHRIVSSRADTQDDFTQITFHAQAGHRYWLHQAYDNFFGSQLEWVDEERARTLISTCEYKELVEAPTDEMLPDGIPYARSLAWRESFE
jgi:hypothetical protein